MNYENAGNRYTAIYLKRKDGTIRRMPFDMVRFNVDEDPSAPFEIVPSGDDSERVFERVWIVRNAPWAKKSSWGNLDI